MKLIVDKIIVLLSSKFIFLSPYRYTLLTFAKFTRLYFSKSSVTLVTKINLWVAYRGHTNRKWLVSSIPLWHKQFAIGVSRKPWLFLWHLKGLNPTLRRNKYRSPIGSWMLNTDFFSGRIRDKIWFLRIFMDGILGKKVMTEFHAFTPSWKKLFLYLSEFAFFS